MPLLMSASPLLVCAHVSPPHLCTCTQCVDMCVLCQLPSPLLVFLSQSGVQPPVSHSWCVCVPLPALGVRRLQCTSLPGSGCLGGRPASPGCGGASLSPCPSVGVSFTPCRGCDSPTSCVGLLLSPQVSDPCHPGLYPTISGCLSLSPTPVFWTCHYVTHPHPVGACISLWPEPGALSSLCLSPAVCRTTDDSRVCVDTHPGYVSPLARCGGLSPWTLGSPGSGCVCTSSPSLSSVPVLLWGACACLCSLATRLACWRRAAVCLHTIGGPRHEAGGRGAQRGDGCLPSPASHPAESGRIPGLWRALYQSAN